MDQQLNLIDYLLFEILLSGHPGELRINIGQNGSIRAITQDRKINSNLIQRQVFTGKALHQAADYITLQIEEQNRGINVNTAI